MDPSLIPPGPIGPYAPPDAAVLRPLLARASLAPALEARIDSRATRLIEAIRSQAGLGGIEAVLRQYSLDTREGLALMVLAEALLRVPDDATADQLIEDKLGCRFVRPRAGRQQSSGHRLRLGVGLSIRVIGSRVKRPRVSWRG